MTPAQAVALALGLSLAGMAFAQTASPGPPAAASPRSTGLGEEARELTEQVRALRDLLLEESRVVTGVATERERVRALKPQVEELGRKFVAAKPAARNRSMEQLATYDQLEADLAGKDAQLRESSALLAARLRELERRRDVINARLAETGRAAANLAVRLNAAAAREARTPRRALIEMRRELENARRAADELRARVSYYALVGNGGDAETRELEKSLATRDAHIVRLERELAAREASLRAAKKSTPSRANSNGAEVYQAHLALADHDVLVVEHALVDLDIDQAMEGDGDLEPGSRRGALEAERDRLEAIVGQLRGTVSTP